MLETTSGIAKRFSRLYRPGATNAQTWYSTYGIAMNTATNSDSLSGAMNGEIRLVEIMVLPAGSFLMSGVAMIVNRSLANHAQGAKTIAMATTAFNRRWRSSTRWEISVPSASDSRSSSLMARTSAAARRLRPQHRPPHRRRGPRWARCQTPWRRDRARGRWLPEAAPAVPPRGAPWAPAEAHG